MPNKQDYTLALDALIRSVGVSGGTALTVLLGAGASITSGVPSAEMCMWEWKRSIFLTNNPGLEDQFSELSLPSVRRRIQEWLDSESSFPCLGSPDEYGFYADKCFPIPEDRRRYFEALAKESHPHIGYHLLCLLAKTGLVDSVWTTNFDGLVAKASGLLGMPVVEVGLDCVDRVNRPKSGGEIQCVALHGDYRYDRLKNTTAEIQSQDQTLRKALIDSLSRANLLVVGYSGKDDSVMSALADAYSQAGNGRLHWCGFGAAEPDQHVESLISLARTNGRDAFYTPISSFDDLMVRLAFHCLQGKDRDTGRDICSRLCPETEPLPFRVDAQKPTNIISSNIFQIECPSEVFQFKTTFSHLPEAWDRLREFTKGQRVAAVMSKGMVLALGTLDDIRKAFGNMVVGEIRRSPIDQIELSDQDGAVIRLLTQALCCSIAECCGLDSNGHGLIWKKNPAEKRNILGTTVAVHDAARLYLRRYRGKQYLVVHPTIKGVDSQGQDLSIETTKELRRSILTYQYNQRFFDTVKEWKNIIFSAKGTDGFTSFEYPAKSASAFLFRVFSIPTLATITDPQRKALPELGRSVKPYVAFEGMTYPEPSLVFSNAQGDGYIKDVHPLRGLLGNKPYDYSLTRQGLCPDVRLGIVCPSQDARQLYGFLDNLQKRISVNSKEEYLIDYQGFDKAFGLHLDIPQPQDNTWAVCPEPNTSLGPQKCARELANSITRCIDALASSAKPSLVLVYIPSRWQAYRSFQSSGVSFDLHDFVKAYCVRAGVTTQFLEEHTLLKKHRCEILWWLACSMYVKAMRTPWVLESLGTETAYAGLGFSIDMTSQSANHVVLGCSHIYNTAGMGLQYKLSKVENPIIRRRNPFMSHDDARRVGENIRQLCYESLMRFPERVVVHKQTPFTQDEKEGLLAGLSGIPAVDMIEITHESALRYTASSITLQGKLKGDAFPIKRGTALVLDENRALLWVHGTARPDVNQSRPNYYMGKSRIPAPLVVTRHHGNSSLSTVAKEILGLSKMDWNSFDMYARLPATIKSSSAIAQIGSLLERFGSASYDYRLFI